VRRTRRLTIALAVLVIAAVAAPSAAGASVHARTADEIRKDAATWAARQVGVREIGSTDCGPVVSRWQRDMGFRTPPCRAWCGAFVHAAFLQAGVRLSQRMISPHNTYYDVLAGRRNLRRIPVRSVRPGDIVLFAYEQGLKASHFGIVTQAFDEYGFVRTVEGNDGNAVYREIHRADVIVLAARVVPR
jgi:hypothetical protein